jgi:hypothetical protein
MKDAILPVLVTVGLMTFAISLAVVADRAVVRERTEPSPFPVECTPRLLIAQPDFFSGRRVRVRIEGCERLSDSQVGYRARADGPFLVLLRFSAPVPEPLPKYVLGECTETREGEIVVVENCK